jgi:hypothetical protein
MGKEESQQALLQARGDQKREDESRLTCDGLVGAA